MLFNSVTFCLFFAVVLLIDRLLRSWTARKGVLLAASYLFYAAWNPPFVVLIWISTGIDWWASHKISAATNPALRKTFLGLSLICNLGLLGFFKYGEFLVNSFTGILASIGIAYAPVDLGIILPVGISFYTFQTLSYTIDVYRDRINPASSLLDFALFVTFFPQLVAGPIVRAVDFLPQLRTPVRADGRQIGWGLTLFIVGLFQKVVLADALLAPAANFVYSSASLAGLINAWMGTLAFSGQIFFDFAGYSTCAIGIALCLGFALPDNFRYPYAAIGFSDFWRRWHISLSTWLRDYLYIPLGGNRKGRVRTYINLMLTMLLGGLWHGASWRFVAWGALHGSYLAGERLIRSRPSLLSIPPWAGMLLTYLLVVITWVFFRASSFGDAWLLLSAMAGMRPEVLGIRQLDLGLVLLVTVAMLLWHWKLRHRSLEWLWSRLPPFARVAMITGMLLMIISNPGEDLAFIYFQF